MMELLASLGRDKAVWIGHDWGSPVVWNIAAHHADKTAGVASLCVPLSRRGLHPREHGRPWSTARPIPRPSSRSGSGTTSSSTRELRQGVQGLRGQHPQHGEGAVPQGRSQVGRQAEPHGLRAQERRHGGHPTGFPTCRADPDVITEQDLEAYTAALTRNGFFGPDSWYMNHKANAAYAKRAPERRQACDARAVPARRLRRHLRDHDLAARRADAPRLRPSSPRSSCIPATGWRRSSRWR